jgi:hypothetical protein
MAYMVKIFTELPNELWQTSILCSLMNIET